MKTKFSLLAILMLATLAQVKAQVGDVTIAKAFYDFSHVDDTTQRDRPSKWEAVLYMSEKGSLYRSVESEQHYPLLYLSNGGTKETFDIIEECPAQVFLGSKSYQAERLIDNKYLITEDKPGIDWKLEDETRNIGGYDAQKATAEFGGRAYIAWFTADIPFPYGPWKLQGLPGLILEASDSKNEVIFRFKGFQNIKKEDVVKIAVPKSFKFKKVSRQEFKNIYSGFQADPLGFMRASLGLPPDSKTKITDNSTVKKKYNNPLEI